jgi:hypothetical protein
MDTFCWAVVYLASVQIAKNPVGTLHALRRLADLHLSLEDDETALHIFHAVLEGGTKMDIHRLRAECMVGIGDIMLRRSSPVQAREMWEAAYLLFIRSSRMKDAASVEKRLEQLPHTRQDNSLPVTGDGAVESTDSASVHLKRSDSDISDTSAMEASIERLGTLLGPNTTPSLQVKTAEDPGTSTNSHTKLSVL